MPEGSAPTEDELEAQEKDYWDQREYPEFPHPLQEQFEDRFTWQSGLFVIGILLVTGSLLLWRVVG